MRPAKTQISLGIRPVWSESSLCAQWVAKDPSLLHADSEDSDQTGRMPRLIWVFAGRTLTLLVLSCRGSNVDVVNIKKIQKGLTSATLRGIGKSWLSVVAGFTEAQTLPVFKYHNGLFCNNEVIIATDIEQSSRDYSQFMHISITRFFIRHHIISLGLT